MMKHLFIGLKSKHLIHNSCYTSIEAFIEKNQLYLFVLKIVKILENALPKIGIQTKFFRSKKNLED